jgi:hypothetical protein
MKYLASFICVAFLFSCNQKNNDVSVKDYFNYGDTGVRVAGIKMIPIKTPVGEFKVWTKRFGNNPKIKILLLHGGPAAGHEYMECFESFFPQEGFEFYEYDQLGAPYSDQPADSSLWTIKRYVDEVDQVRKGRSIHIAVATINASGSFNFFLCLIEIAFSLISLLKVRITTSSRILSNCRSSLFVIPKQPFNSISVNSEI